MKADEQDAKKRAASETQILRDEVDGLRAKVAAAAQLESQLQTQTEENKKLSKLCADLQERLEKSIAEA